MVALPPALSVMSEPAVELVKPFTTFMSPVLSTRMLLCVIAETRSLFKTVAVVPVEDWKTPSIKEPVVGPVELMFTVAATNVGVTESEVPTKASAVTVKV
jgi:hypothetical protein